MVWPESRVRVGAEDFLLSEGAAPFIPGGLVA